MIFYPAAMQLWASFLQGLASNENLCTMLHVIQLNAILTRLDGQNNAQSLLWQIAVA